MKKLVGIVFIILGIGLVLSVVFQIVRFSTTSEVDYVEKAANQYKAIIIKSTSVDWEVQESDDENIRVELLNPRKNQSLEVRDRNQLEIEVKEKGLGLNFFNFQNQNTKLLVKLPKQMTADLEFHGVSGDIEVLGEMMAQKLFVETVSGDIHFNHKLSLEELSLRTISGDIVVGLLDSNQMDFQTTSGSIEVEEASGDVSGETVSGKINIRLPHHHKDIDVSTVSGNIELEIGDPNAKIELETVSGRLDLDQALEQMTESSRKLSGTIGSGDYQIKANTVSGNIYLN
ncbi:hypothetical protein BTS2_2605 [Bacillus sp. TS-2]|nr:hypothetical protein BTS2_2605 [Bacillus sp. TS-2]